MNDTYSTMLYENKHLIIKTVPGKEPFVIASAYAADVAKEICQLLNENAEKGESQ